jgi:hypothetical protein
MMKNKTVEKYRRKCGAKNVKKCYSKNSKVDVAVLVELVQSTVSSAPNRATSRKGYAVQIS